MHRRPASLASLLAPALALVALAVPAVPAAPLDPADAAAAADALAWLATQQQADGGFEVAGFPGFETPDAVLALASGAQSGEAWSTAEALAAVQAVERDGLDALDALDDQAEAPGLGAGPAAKLVVLVAGPLGLDASDFDPQGDSAAPVDLAAAIAAGANGDGSYGPPGALNDTLYAALALELLDGAVPPATLAYVRSVRQADGGWNFLGDPAGTDVDVDTTARAVQVLVAAGVAVDDPGLAGALAFLAAHQQPTGAWAAFGADDPNSTAMAVLALLAAGRDPTSRCWRDAARPEAFGTPYADPLAWLRAQQDPATGRVASPNDVFGVNTIATTQAVEALLGRWLPTVRAPGGCVPPVPVGGPAIGGTPLAVVDGAVRPVPDGAPAGVTVVAGAFTPGGTGGWTVGPDGGVFTAGDAPFAGSLGGLPLNAPVVGLAPTATGAGYRLVAADGGVFAFGDASFHGGLGATRLNAPVVGLAATCTGAGYWLVAADGGVFAFGDAAFHGSLGAGPLNEPVVGITPAPGCGGYWLLGGDGGVFAFGDAAFHGSLAGTGVAARVLAPFGSGGGYWILDATGAARPLGG